MNVRLYDLTGMVGQGVPRECLLDTDVDVVQTVGRTPTGVQHPKLREVVQRMSTNIPTPKRTRSGFDACSFCLGVSSAGMKEADYKRVTSGFTLARAEVPSLLNPRCLP